MILTNSGRVYGCGSNEQGQLGLGDNVSERSTPQRINGLSSVRSISAGHYFSLVRARDGLFVMGDNTYGQLCTDTREDPIYSPTRIESNGDPVPSNLVQSFKAGAESTYILFTDGSVVACGQNDFGELGDGTNNNSFGTAVKLPDDKDAVEIGTGPSAKTVFYVMEDGSVYATGLNNRGQVGDGTTNDRNRPVEIDFPNRADIRFISAANTHTLAN